MKKATEALKVQIPEPDFQTISLTIKNIIGSSMIMNRFSEKAGESIKNTQLQIPIKKTAKDPKADFEASKYLTSDGKLGVPAIAVKAAMVRAAKVTKENMTDMRIGFHVIGDIIPFVKHSKPIHHEDFIPLPTGGRDWKNRCEIKDWTLKVPITFNSNFISAAQLTNLLSLAGFHCGLMDNRPNSPKCSGNHGMFALVR